MNKSVTLRLLGFVAFLIFHITGCKKAPYYEKTVEIPHAQWKETDTLRFTLAKPDTGMRYTLSLGFRIGNSYPYSNLYIIFISRFPDKRFSQDTLQFLLSDARGRPTGNCSGKVCDYNFDLRKNLKFPLHGDYIFEAVQAMRTPNGNLSDVRALYLRVDPDAPPASVSPRQ